MNRLSRFLPLLALPLLAVLPLRAALNPAQIPADAKWVFHVDLNTLRTSAVGKELLTVTRQAQLELVQQIKVGIDAEKLLTTIGAVTAYGANFSNDPSLIDGTLILEGTADLRKIAESLLLQGTLAAPEQVKEVKDLPFPAYSIDAPREPNTQGPKNEVFIAFPPEPIVLISKSRPQLQRAREIIAGSAASIARTPAAPLGQLLKPAAGAFVFAASLVPAEQMFPQDGPQTRILQMTNSASLAIGESGLRTFAHAELSASSGDTADKLMKILQGMAAMLSLAETNDKYLAEFLSSTAVTRADNIVTLHLAYDSRRLVEMAHAIVVDNARAPAAPTPVPVQPAPPATRTLEEWNAAQSTEPDYAPANATATRTLSAVALKNGTSISLGSRANGGRAVSFSRVEIAPAQGGAPMVFTSDMMRRGNERGANTATFAFPGTEGSYTVKLTYANDPEGKAIYFVSARDPRPAAPVATPAGN